MPGGAWIVRAECQTGAELMGVGYDQPHQPQLPLKIAVVVNRDSARAQRPQASLTKRSMSRYVKVMVSAFRLSRTRYWRAHLVGPKTHWEVLGADGAPRFNASSLGLPIVLDQQA